MAETFRERAERIRLFEVTADPHARALAEGKSLVGTALTPTETFKLSATFSAAIWAALVDLCDQLDALSLGQIEP